MARMITALLVALVPELVFAVGDGNMLDLTTYWVGYASIAIFTVAYLLIIVGGIHAPAQIQTRRPGSGHHRLGFRLPRNARRGGNRTRQSRSAR